MNKFSKGSYEYENRHDLIKELDKSFPNRKTDMKLIEVFRDAENHIDELVKICVKEKFWNMYGVE